MTSSSRKSEILDHPSGSQIFFLDHASDHPPRPDTRGLPQPWTAKGAVTNGPSSAPGAKPARPHPPLQRSATLPCRIPSGLSGAPWEERLVKFAGIGPVDETGMPIACRSNVNQPRDWYRSMFRQIHQRPEGVDRVASGLWSSDASPLSTTCPPPRDVVDGGPSKQDPFTRSPHGALPDWSDLVDGDERYGSGPQRQREPKSIFDFEPSQAHSGGEQNQAQVSPGLPLARLRPSSIEVSLVSELSRLEAELDSDIQVLERKLSQKQQRGLQSGRGEGSRNKVFGRTESEQNSSPLTGALPPVTVDGATLPVTQRTASSPAQEGDPDPISRRTAERWAMQDPPKREEQKMKAARAKFSFQAQSPKELTLQKGDVAYIHRQVDANWFQGEHHGRVGIFPASYVELLSPTEKPMPVKAPVAEVLEHGEAVALYNFTAELQVELPLRKGEQICVIRQVDDNWLEGRLPGYSRTGIFPSSYVQLNKKPRAKPRPDSPSSPCPVNTGQAPQLPPAPPIPITHPSSPKQLLPVQGSPFPGSNAPSMAQSHPQPAPNTLASNHWPESFPCPTPFNPQTRAEYNQWSGVELAGQNVHIEVGCLKPATNQRLESPPGAGERSSPSLQGGSTPNSDQSIHLVKAPPLKKAPTNHTLALLPRQPHKAVYGYKPRNTDELELREGDLVQVIEKCEDGWFVGTSERTSTFGTFPGNYVVPV